MRPLNICPPLHADTPRAFSFFFYRRFIADLAVEHAYQGKGIGRQLIQEAR